MTTIDIDLFATYKLSLPPRTRCIANDLVSDVLVSSDVDEAGWAIEAEYPNDVPPAFLQVVSGWKTDDIVAMNREAQFALSVEIDEGKSDDSENEQ